MDHEWMDEWMDVIKIEINTDVDVDIDVERVLCVLEMDLVGEWVSRG